MQKKLENTESQRPVDAPVSKRIRKWVLKEIADWPDTGTKDFIELMTRNKVLQSLLLIYIVFMLSLIVYLIASC